MNQKQRREHLLRFLLDETHKYNGVTMPSDETDQWNLLRSLMNMREPMPVSEAFLEMQDAYLQEEIAAKGVTDADSLPSTSTNPKLVLWRGDITTLKADAIVNAANSAMLGCFTPCHNCIDNVIHTYAGVQLRLECAAIMARQGHPEPTGTAKITKAYNLPSKYILHTVGPIVTGVLTDEHRTQLASCYRACLELAADYGLSSVAFCCISTGVFCFPNEEAADIAIKTVSDYLASNNHRMKVIFNVFTQQDEHIYLQRLG